MAKDLLRESERARSPWRKSGRLNACPNQAPLVVRPRGGAGGFACVPVILAESPTNS